MLKKLTVREVNEEQREFDERAAHACRVQCAAGCHGGGTHGDHFVVTFSSEVIG